MGGWVLNGLVERWWQGGGRSPETECCTVGGVELWIEDVARSQWRYLYKIEWNEFEWIGAAIDGK